MRTLHALAGVAAAAVVAGTAAADEITIALGAEPTSIDPHYWSGAPNVAMGRNIFDHLVNPDAAYQMKPGLATSWKALDDTTWEFTLRQGVKWHDGSPFTADDVVFTFKHAPDAGLKQFSPYIKGRLVKKIDDHKVLITTEGPDPLVPNNLAAFSVVSAKHGQGAKPEDYNTGRVTHGTGPFKFVEWISGDRIVLEANPDYWGGKAAWDMVTLKPIKSGPSRIAALISGDVDMVDYVPTTDVAQLRKNSKIEISQGPSARVIFIQLDVSRDISPFVFDNAGKPMFPNPLRDWRVRQAINLAIDRRGIVDRVMDNNAVAASQILAKGFFGFNDGLEIPKADPEAARQLLKRAGYGDGFKMTIHGPNDRYDNDAQILEAWAQMLTKVGIETTVDAMPKATFFTRAAKPEFSFSMGANGSRTGEASVPLKAFCHSRWPDTGFGVYSRTRYANERLDPIIEEALVIIDDAKRQSLFHEAMEICMRDAAYIPSHYQVNTWGLRKGLKYAPRVDEFTLPYGVTKG